MSITFNGVNSDGLNIICEKYPTLSRPKRKGETYSIPGRSGDVIVQYDAYDNYTQPYQIIAGEGTDGSAETTFIDVAAWLFQEGYCELVDSSEPGYYRMASFSGPLDVNNIMTKYGRCIVNFNCQPYRYRANVADVSLTGDGVITNPEMFSSRPLIKVYGHGDITINGTTVTIAQHSQPYLYIDCDSQQAYYDEETYMGGSVVIEGEYPKLAPGANTITMDSTITQLIISPRWRTL